MATNQGPARCLGRFLLLAAAVLAAWAILAVLTGGFRIDLGGLRVSSRNPLRISLFALLAAALAWRLAYHDWLELHVCRWIPGLRRLALPVVLLLSAALLTAGVVRGVRTAGGADPAGYVSQSALWRGGTLKVPQPFVESLPWPDARSSFVPLGYRAGPDEHMVPT